MTATAHRSYFVLPFVVACAASLWSSSAAAGHAKCEYDPTTFNLARKSEGCLGTRDVDYRHAFNVVAADWFGAGYDYNSGSFPEEEKPYCLFMTGLHMLTENASFSTRMANANDYTRELLARPLPDCSAPHAWAQAPSSEPLWDGDFVEFNKQEATLLQLGGTDCYEEPGAQPCTGYWDLDPLAKAWIARGQPSWWAWSRQ